jgi:hypothetical protein
MLLPLLKEKKWLFPMFFLLALTMSTITYLVVMIGKGHVN